MTRDKKEQILAELTNSYWMEMETVMNYVCNFVLITPRARRQCGHLSGEMAT